MKPAPKAGLLMVKQFLALFLNDCDIRGNLLDGVKFFINRCITDGFKRFFRTGRKKDEAALALR